MIRRPPRSTRTDTLFPYTTLFRSHEIFGREGNDLHCSVPISVVTAALGGELEVPTLEGKIEVDVPEGSQSGKQFRLRGRGVRSVRTSGPGDLYCTVFVETPVRLTKAQKELLKQFGETLATDNKHHPEASRWKIGTASCRERVCQDG